ncbi:mannitol-1-phosphate 5-dehydrogenase [Salinibacterium sp. dk2585]|uniref:mannitol-1-phosphate 5-dehydrogenase n=1 Tax=unclassified Salinibacterium TaxID=2632331 RepID=UPI0011C24EE6|nr:MULTISPECIES: mannitol-1-phosphate 5-dehydrogenase [unclassified Salinibacterium]QEE60792.1 mannitol-1-phosphate 5-dehydrogenase [Salinibacterium sp. dk2585]TXK55864.1 mannitol-1-phosphate 5-dehydrogenase [Salinibacterium sp. dk5596]
MKAVHFGAGNIGRGFVGLLLHEAGYEVVFVDVAAELIDSLAAAESYTVHEVGEGARDHRVEFFRALNSAVDPDAVVAEIATAEVVTTAVGPNVLKFVAPLIAEALLQRSLEVPLAVMACENAINATDTLREHVAQALAEKGREADAATALSRAVFANTAVDRIVPGQPGEGGLDVTVEAYFEWAIDRSPFGGEEPSIPGATWVDDLAPYIERKLFTVNTGHATIAYYGFAAGARAISDALGHPEVESAVRAVLAETKQLLVAKHGLDESAQQAYIDKILTRFANPHLPDTVDRVGRQPLRKLSRNERFIGPAAELAERGTVPEALIDAVGTALGFDVPDDEQSVQMREKLQALTPEEFVQEVCGIGPSHPLFEPLVAVVPTPSG